MYKVLPQTVDLEYKEADDSEDEYPTLTEKLLVSTEDSSPFLLKQKPLLGLCRDFSAEAPDLQQRPALSKVRQLVFILSVINCCTFIVTFLWVLPCNYETCTQKSLGVKDLEWKLEIPATDHLQMDVASSSSKLKDILVVIRYPNNFTANLDSPSINGIQLRDSKDLWLRNWTEPISSIHCSLIDVNNDGLDDCLLLSGPSQKLHALDSATGLPIWRFNCSDCINMIGIQSVPDVDGDSTSDLAAVATSFRSKILLIISGQQGKLLWQGSVLSNCTYVHVTDPLRPTTPLIDTRCSQNASGLPKLWNLLPILQRGVSTEQPLWETRNHGQCPQCSATLVLKKVSGELLSNRTFDQAIIGPQIRCLGSRLAFNIQRYRQENGTRFQETGIQIVSLGPQPTLSRINTDGPAEFILHKGLIDLLVTATSHREPTGSTSFWLKKNRLP